MISGRLFMIPGRFFYDSRSVFLDIILGIICGTGRFLLHPGFITSGFYYIRGFSQKNAVVSPYY